MNDPQIDTSELLRKAQNGDETAINELLAGHCGRLRQMVAYNLDNRLVSRIDPSDVVQEALVEASRRLPTYAEQQPVAFYPWLRSIAWERLLNLQQHHLAQKRSVMREQQDHWVPSDESVALLADRFVGGGTSPSQRMKRQESQDRVRKVLSQLPSSDREVLVLRYLEQLTVSEAVAALDISEHAFMKRHMRAIQRFRRLLEET